MKLKKLFHVLVVGGATLGAAGCGPGPDQPLPEPSTQNPPSTDGGTTTAPDSGPHFW